MTSGRKSVGWAVLAVALAASHIAHAQIGMLKM